MKRFFALLCTLTLLAFAPGCTPQDAPAGTGLSSTPQVSGSARSSMAENSKTQAASSSGLRLHVSSAGPVSSAVRTASKVGTNKAASSSKTANASSRKPAGSSSKPAAKQSSKAQTPVSEMVWVSRTGKKYHSNSGCSNMKDPQHMSKDDAVAMGRTPCKKCW